jgi:HSP20 family molecular chaperone IbpA
MNDSRNLARHANQAPERVTKRATVAPLVDVYEDQNELLLVADVPGATKDDINVSLEKGLLSIEVKRSDAYDYFRAFSIPQGIDGSKIDAELKSGVLRLRLPKSEATKSRRIEIRVQ